MDASVVVINWNSGFLLTRLLDSLGRMRDEFRELIVIDNGSGDESRQAGLGRSDIRWIGLSENRGFAGASNLGVSQAGSPLVFLFNPDLQIRPGVLAWLVDRAQEHPEAAIVCGALINEQGKNQFEFQIRPLPTLAGVLSDVLFVDGIRRRMGWPRFRNGVIRRPDPAEGTEAPWEVEQPAAACWLIRKEAWMALGGFDERFRPAWFEDVDFCLRARRAGWKILYYPQVSIIHRGGSSLAVLTHRRFLKSYYGNLLKYWKKHHPAGYLLLWLPVQIGRLVRSLGPVK